MYLYYCNILPLYQNLQKHNFKIVFCIFHIIFFNFLHHYGTNISIPAYFNTYKICHKLHSARSAKKELLKCIYIYNQLHYWKKRSQCNNYNIEKITRKSPHWLSRLRRSLWTWDQTVLHSTPQKLNATMPGQFYGLILSNLEWSVVMN